jgi:hypothetical protein
MLRDATLKYSLAGALLLLFGANAVFVYLAAHAAMNQRTFSIAPETMPIGIKWLLLLGVAVVAVGIAYWSHRAFLEGGVSPVDTTWADFVIIAYAVLTFITLLFLGEAYWLFFAIILILLFLFTIFVTKRLLNSTSRWAAWVAATLLLTALAIIFTATMIA